MGILLILLRHTIKALVSKQTALAGVLGLMQNIAGIYARGETWKQFRTYTEYSDVNQTISDVAWAKFTTNGFVAIPHHEAADFGLPLAEDFPDDPSKGVYVLEAFHEMHCVIYLRETIQALLSGKSVDDKAAHINHCYDALRQAIQCRADDTPIYIPYRSRLTGDGQHRPCRDWNALENWAQRHSACWPTGHCADLEMLDLDVKTMNISHYQQVDGVADGDEFQETQQSTHDRPELRTWNLRCILIGVGAGLILGALTSLIISMEPKDTYTRKMAAWSPALDTFNDQLSIQRFNGALRDPNKYRGPPSQEIDDAWDELIYPEGGLVRLSKAQLDKINASEYAAEYTEELGGGYIATIEVFHQLHCVNMLRKATNMDYYLSRIDEWEDGKTLRYHLDHCIDMLRQKLMCDPDVGMVTYVWAKGWKQPFPDFNTIHKCRDYSKVLEWARRNYVHGRDVADIERAPGALERDTRP
ncbi:hypothetical protein ABOM_005775 [Aspergillus bombycis]|uniref:Tat pathway signal sequence n=1 Tax=Aspergillus bombycis TaxID=109264 RepID=A0A1F7ZZU7_9EURO|nr:hypothetical protein ABOM_005775 [Aspergillus bombycis]OGM44990.1 hypothetical protein ABOM_005775 [Aspergillus bombycis]